jgi:hypothetical protein
VLAREKHLSLVRPAAGGQRRYLCTKKVQVSS